MLGLDRFNCNVHLLHNEMCSLTSCIIDRYRLLCFYLNTLVQMTLYVAVLFYSTVMLLVFMDSVDVEASKMFAKCVLVLLWFWLLHTISLFELGHICWNFHESMPMNINMSTWLNNYRQLTVKLMIQFSLLLSYLVIK